MPERPLLIFPTPHVADRTKHKKGVKSFHKPDVSRQGERLSPVFAKLQKEFEARRIEIQQTTAGIDPEQVLVIETVGSVEDFSKAVKKFPGLEWMGEFEIDDIPPDSDFYDNENSEKKLSGRLYLLMTNTQALRQMLSLWRRFQENQTMKFQRGLAKFRDIFSHIKDIRMWDVQDRFQDTGVISAWEKELEDSERQFIKFEIDLWYRQTKARRLTSERIVSKIIEKYDGRLVAQSVISEISYHALLCELPASAIRDIMANKETQLVRCENIMFFRPTGQSIVGKNPVDGEVETISTTNLPQPSGDPIIALLDGVPLTNHILLANRLIIDDPDSFESGYQASEREHGTAMASLIAHGDLSRSQNPLPRPIYVRPIMKPIDWPNHPRPEAMPNDHLEVDLIHRAVRRMFEVEGDSRPTSPHIKIINLSIGNTVQLFYNSMSPMARLIDWLSYKYNILFIVSAGNHDENINLNINLTDFKNIDSDQREYIFVKELYNNTRNRKLLSPAESINGITVGSVHYDNSNYKITGDRIDPFSNLLPSPVSAFGSGYRRAIKPDIVYYGGKQLYQLPLLPSQPLSLPPNIFRTAPGIKHASSGNQAGQLDATSYTCGTSNATALISRFAGICYDKLQEIFTDQALGADYDVFSAVLLKTMLVHGCSQGEIGKLLASILKTPDSRRLKSLVSQWLGYGVPDTDRVLDCTAQRATVLGFGKLSDGEANLFRLPLPPSLASLPEKRRLTVTLAWISPISSNSQQYRIANLWFELADNRLANQRSEADWQAVRRGTVQHEIFEGERAEPFTDGAYIEIKVNCRKDAGEITSPVSYGLAVSLEVAQGTSIDIYDEIRNRIAPAIQIQPIDDQSEN